MKLKFTSREVDLRIFADRFKSGIFDLQSIPLKTTEFQVADRNIISITKDTLTIIDVDKNSDQMFTFWEHLEIDK